MSSIFVFSRYCRYISEEIYEVPNFRLSPYLYCIDPLLLYIVCLGTGDSFV
jgi:hypothetical protein